jgi:hypothetical protein
VVAGVFLDISKAFDRVWHQALLAKMVRLQFPAWATRLIRSYLQDRTFTVQWLGTGSVTRQALAGVPQGSVKGPLLFNIYSHDIPRDHGRHTVLSLYADDAAILSRSWQ